MVSSAAAGGAAPVSSMDHALFLWIQEHLRTPWLDDVMLALNPSMRHLNIAVGALVLYLLIRLKGRSRMTLLLALLAVGLCDLTTNRIIKPLVGRPRPYDVYPSILVVGRSPGSASFPSSHAANTMSAAVIFLARAGWKAVPVLVLAVAVGFSRVYLGHHYPGDVLGGMVVGAASAGVVLALAHYGRLARGTWLRLRSRRRHGDTGEGTQAEGDAVP